MSDDIIQQALDITQGYGNGADGLNELGQREALVRALHAAGLLRDPERDGGESETNL